MQQDARELVNLFDYEARARELLSRMAYEYYAGGANDEITLRENRAAYERISLYPYVLRDVSQRDLSTTVLGERVSMPVLNPYTGINRDFDSYRLMPSHNDMAAMLDLLWSPVSFERLVTDWELEPKEAIVAITWTIGLIQRALKEGPRPRS